MNLANKYRPKTFEDVTEQGVTTEILNKLCKSEDLQLRNFLLTGPAGTGKAQPLYSKVLTPEGYIKMGEVTSGTKVIVEDGSTATVTDVYPQGDRHVWQINLRDKTSFRVADNHLNVVIDPYSGERKVLTTIELMAAVNAGGTLYIPLCAPIQKDYSHVSVNPYLLGQLIGVRNCAKPTDSIAVPFDKLDMCLQSFTKLSCNYGVIKYGERFAEIKFDAEDITQKLATEGTDLTCIPRHYVYNSVIVREQLLQGIVDAIGTLFREYAAFMVTKPINNLDLLIRSLGLYCEMQQNEPRQNYYLIEVNKDISVSSKPKSDYISIGRKITSIEYVGCEPCQCIMVDHPLHTYITDNFTVTHNTTSARIMANILNDGQGEPIEIDAASHSGVNDIREIVEQAQSYPVGSKYKVFIVDECFAGSTWISTPSGKVQIKDIKAGDTIYNLTGQAQVSKVFKNRVNPSNLVFVRYGSANVVTTADHLFFTNYGWVCAKDLKKGDLLYDYKNMQGVRERVSSFRFEQREGALQQGVSSDIYAQEDVRKEVQQLSKNVSNLWKELLNLQECELSDMFSEMWRSLEKAESEYGTYAGSTFKTLAYIYLSGMRQANGDSEQRSQKSLLKSMCVKTGASCLYTQDVSEDVRMVWEYICCRLFEERQQDMLSSLQRQADNLQADRSQISRIVDPDEAAQPYERSGCCCQNDANKREEWHATQAACDAWWKRAIYCSADSFEEGLGRSVDLRISCEDTCAEDKPRTISYKLQTRPSLSRAEARCRGGWCRPQYEIASIVRRKEDSMLRSFRVDSVESYQRGCNDELFRSSFTDTELHSDHVILYDLELEGHPSYYANNVLVHNCHAITSTAWQVLLKCLESNPGRTIMVFCTTNPEKIPATILSRVQTFQLSKISLKGIQDRLVYVLEQEKAEGRQLTYDVNAVNYIAKLAQGGMRDALTSLDKCLAYSSDITMENVEKALNLPNYDDYFKLLNFIAKKDNNGIVSVINDVYDSGVNFIKWFDGFMAFISNIIKYIYIQDISATMIPEHYKDKIAGYGAAHAALCLKLSNKLVKLNQELRTTQYLQELAITYLCTQPAVK